MSNSDLTLHGRLVDAPELRFTPQGKAVANVTIAVNERIKDGDSGRTGTPHSSALPHGGRWQRQWSRQD